ncbi:helix-turn-helix transcriptional regulator [Mannheimia indoligenes]|uniref:helix-turn-helix domain-containing protein n=1 Tax=Mannheimia indoligenes TaxID=3103145 RepID=UPI002FE57512
MNEKIRKLREAKEWSQKKMAEKMHMFLNGYSKIERDETKLYVDKSGTDRSSLDIDIVKLMNSAERSICFQINENTSLSLNFRYYVAVE